MARPGPVHALAGLVLLVLFEHLERPRVQRRVLPAGIEGGHPADGQDPPLVADLGHDLAQRLEEGHVVWDGVAVGQHPGGVGEREVDQARHVVPAPQVEGHDVVPKVVDELLHLKGHGMRFHQGHALDVILGPAACLGHGPEDVSPPQPLLGGLRLGDVDRERMLEPGRVDLEGDQRQVEERGGEQLVLDHPRLVQVESAGPDGDHGPALGDGDLAVPLLVGVLEAAAKRQDDVAGAVEDIGPGVGHGVLQVEHHPGRARVEHFDHQLPVVGRPGHLVALVLAPAG